MPKRKIRPYHKTHCCTTEVTAEAWQQALGSELALKLIEQAHSDGDRQAGKADPDCKRCHGEGIVSEYEIRQPFNPGSSLQKANLIRHLGLKMPLKRGEQRETTESKYLKRFAKRFPVFGTIVECQERQKLLSTYLWQPASDGRIHSTFGYAPSTWRKNSRGPNVQNIPKRYDLAKLVRATIVAAPGMVLLEADSASIEAVLVGFCAGDSEYVRIAKLGLHGFITLKWMGHNVDLSQPDADLAKLFKEAKKAHPEEYECAKRGGHGSNYMLSPHGLNDEWPEFFPTRKKAEEFQEFYFGLFPKLRAWQQSTLERSHKETYLENHYEYRHYFWSVYQWDRRREQWTLGDDAKRAVAFVPQSDASAIQSDDLLTLDAMPEVSPYLRLIIHDSFVLEVPEREALNVARLVHGVQCRPRAELGGLSIGAAVSIGPNLAEMEEVSVE